MESRVIVRVLAGLLVLMVAGCSLAGQKPPVLAGLTVTDHVDQHTRAPATPRSQFPAEATEFFASVKVENALKGTRVAAEWYFEGRLIDEVEVVFPEPGSRYVAFNLASSGQRPFPAGLYRVKIRLDGSGEQEALFSVGAQPS